MSMKRKAVEFALWAGMDTEEILFKLRTDYPEMDEAYVEETERLMNDSFLLEE